MFCSDIDELLGAVKNKFIENDVMLSEFTNLLQHLLLVPGGNLG